MNINVTKKVLSSFIAGAMAVTAFGGVIPEVMPSLNTTLTASAAEVEDDPYLMYGDADLNAVIDLSDATVIARHILSPNTFPLGSRFSQTEESIVAATKCADVYKDNVIDMRDLSCMAEYNLGQLNLNDLGNAYPETDTASVSSPIGLKLTTEKLKFSTDELANGVTAKVYVDRTGSVSETDCLKGFRFSLTSDSWGKVDPSVLMFTEENALGTEKGNVTRQRILSFVSGTISQVDKSKPRKTNNSEGYRIDDYYYIEGDDFISNDSHKSAALMMSDSEHGFFRDGEGEHIAEFEIKFPKDLEPGKYTIGLDDATALICPDGEITGTNGMAIVDMPIENEITFTVKEYPKVTNIAVDDDGNVTWDAAKDALAYQVEKIVDDKTYYGKKITDTSYTFESTPPYDYKIAVKAYFEDEDDPSKIIISRKEFDVTVKEPLGVPQISYVYDDGRTISINGVSKAAYYKVGIIINGKTYYSNKIPVNVFNGHYVLKRTPSCNYEAFVIAYNEKGQYTISDKYKVEVSNPLDTVTGVKASANGTVTWDKVINASSYKVAKVVNGVTYYSERITDNSYTFKATPASDYQVFVIAYNDENAYITSEKIDVTVDKPLGTVNDVKVDKNCKITWTKADNAVSYKVGKRVNGVKYYGEKVTDTSYSFKNIPNKDYEVFVVAFDKNGRSTWGSPKPVQSGAMGTVSNIKVDKKTGTISWNAARNVTAYKVGKVVGSKTYYSSKITDTSYKFSNVPLTEYQIFVIAFDKDGKAIYSPKVTVNNGREYIKTTVKTVAITDGAKVESFTKNDYIETQDYGSGVIQPHIKVIKEGYYATVVKTEDAQSKRLFPSNSWIGMEKTRDRIMGASEYFLETYDNVTSLFRKFEQGNLIYNMRLPYSGKTYYLAYSKYGDKVDAIIEVKCEHES